VQAEHASSTQTGLGHPAGFEPRTYLVGDVVQLNILFFIKGFSTFSVVRTKRKLQPFNFFSGDSLFCI